MSFGKRNDKAEETKDFVESNKSFVSTGRTTVSKKIRFVYSSDLDDYVPVYKVSKN